MEVSGNATAVENNNATNVKKVEVEKEPQATKEGKRKRNGWWSKESCWPHGLESNDPNLTSLEIGACAYLPADRNWSKAGKLIGKHQHLVSLRFNDVYYERGFRSLMRGVAKNRSIRNLTIHWVNGDGVWGGVFDTMGPFFRHNLPLLQKFVLTSCKESLPDSPQEIHSLSSAFRECKSTCLEIVQLNENRLGDDLAAELISSLSSFDKLRELNVSGNFIGLKGCKALAGMICKPDCSLEKVSLIDSCLTDNEAEILANSLKTNHTLHYLDMDRWLPPGINVQELGYYHIITAKGWSHFTNVLCDTSTIAKTYSSNHTLSRVMDYYSPKFQGVPPGNDLLSLLKLNENGDKKYVARQKILHHHFVTNFRSDKLIVDEEINLFPEIIAWIGKSSDDLTRLAMFELFRKMPSVFVSRSAALKRKRGIEEV